MGKLKEAWPILFVVVAAVIVIMFVVNKPAKKNNTVSYTTQEAEAEIPDAYTPAETPAETSVVTPEVVSASEAVGNELENQVIHTNPQTTKKSGVFSIQVFSFKEEERAKDALRAIRQGGYEDAYILVSDLGEKGTWHRVRVGYFDDEEEAKVLLQKLRTEFNSGIIVRN